MELKIYGILMKYSGVLDIAYFAWISVTSILCREAIPHRLPFVYVFFAVYALMTPAKFWMAARHNAAPKAPEKLPGIIFHASKSQSSQNSIFPGYVVQRPIPVFFISINFASLLSSQVRTLL